MVYIKRLTHRAIARFLEAIDTKLAELLRKKTREHPDYDEDAFDEAMKDEQLNLQV